MDPVGILSAFVAVALYPGGLYVVVAALLVARFGRLAGAGESITADQVVGCVLAVLAISLAPLPGSPAESLPSGGGAPSSLAASILLLAVAVAITVEAAWTAERALCALVAVVPLLSLAASTSTLAFPTVVAVPGTAISVARALAGAALLLVAPLLVPPPAAGARLPRALVLSSMSILAVSLVAPSWLRSAPAWIAGGVVLAVAVMAGTMAPELWRLHGRRPWVITVVAGLLATMATALAVLSGA